MRKQRTYFFITLIVILAGVSILCFFKKTAQNIKTIGAQPKQIQTQNSQQASPELIKVQNPDLKNDLEAERHKSQILEREVAAMKKAAVLPPIEIAQDVPGIGVQWGSLKLKFHDFNKKYPKAPLKENTSEYADYANDLDALTHELTPIMLTASEISTLTKEPIVKAQFMSSMIAEALSLDAVTKSGLENTLRTVLLNSSASAQPNYARDQVRQLLSSDQQIAFDSMFGNNFLHELKFSIFDKDGKETNF